MLFVSSVRSAYRAPGLGRRAASAIASKDSKAVFGAAFSKSPQTFTKVHTELSSDSTSDLSLQERNKGLKELFAKLKGTGRKVIISEDTKKHFGVLSENGRIGEGEGVIEDFSELVAQHKGDLTTSSATPLRKDILTRLETILKQLKAVKIANKVCWFEFLSD